MAIFTDQDADSGARDFRLAVQRVTLFWRESLLDESCAWLEVAGYDVVQLDARRWHTPADAHGELAAALDFPDYYGRNWDAFNDCMGDVVAHEYGTSREATGLALVLRGLAHFEHAHPRDAYVLVDVFAGWCRAAALTGHRMMLLVQSDDPRFVMEPVDAVSAMWNGAEFLNSSRGV